MATQPPPTTDEGWKFGESRRFILHLDPKKPGRGYLHVSAMAAALMALRGEQRNFEIVNDPKTGAKVLGEPIEAAAARLDAEGWVGLAVEVKPVGYVRSGGMAITVEKRPPSPPKNARAGGYNDSSFPTPLPPGFKESMEGTAPPYPESVLGPPPSQRAAEGSSGRPAKGKHRARPAPEEGKGDRPEAGR